MVSEQGDADPVLLDHKGLGRPPVFDGSRERFEAWSFSFESYCALLGWDGYVTTAVNLDPTDYPNGVPRADLGDRGDRVSRNIFHLLVQIVRGHALTHLTVRTRKWARGDQAHLCRLSHRVARRQRGPAAGDNHASLVGQET